ncbi:MAG: aspartate/glutamate racemase family protein [Acetobacterales bacterium]
MTLRIGTIAPSSNVVVEDVSADVLAGLDGVRHHVARLPYAGAIPATGAPGYDLDAMRQAARLLADAKVDVLLWNGSKGGSIGFEHDEALCAALTAETGLPAVTSGLAVLELFARAGVRRFGLVTPYVPAKNAEVVRCFAARGYECVAEAGAGESDNYAFSTVGADRVESMLRTVAAERPDAIVPFCTNLDAAAVAARLEPELGIPVVDSVLAGLWSALRTAGYDAGRITGWGRMFAL